MKACAAIIAACLATVASAADPPACDPASLQPLSYRLVTEAQALNVTADRSSWWDGFELGKHEETAGELNDVATMLAERALQEDARNVMAHAQLARLQLVAGNTDAAHASWSRALDAGLAVVFTGTLHDVDARTYFVLAFDREAMRVYRMDAFGPVTRGKYGLPDFPPPTAAAFWRAMSGCLGDAKPEALIPWADVKTIRAGNWVLWLELAKPVRVTSDRTSKGRSIDEIKVALHGATGSLEVYDPAGGGRVAMRGRGPAAFQDAFRRTLAQFVDPKQRIALPPLKPGAGW